MSVNWNYATKAIVSLLGNAEYVLSQYPHITWQQAATALVTTFLVWFVPNSPANTPNPSVPAMDHITNAERAELNALRAKQ